jgi:hypothetical protein
LEKSNQKPRPVPNTSVAVVKIYNIASRQEIFLFYFRDFLGSSYNLLNQSIIACGTRYAWNAPSIPASAQTVLGSVRLYILLTASRAVLLNGLRKFKTPLAAFDYQCRFAALKLH